MRPFQKGAKCKCVGSNPKCPRSIKTHMRWGPVEDLSPDDVFLLGLRSKPSGMRMGLQTRGFGGHHAWVAARPLESNRCDMRFVPDFAGRG